MRIIQPSHEILTVDENPLLAIEKAGRLCYKSEANVTADSAEKFVAKLLENRHLAMLEHATVYIRLDKDAYEDLSRAPSKDTRYLVLTRSITPSGDCYVASGNVRAWYELIDRKSRYGSPYASVYYVLQLILERYLPTVFASCNTDRVSTCVGTALASDDDFRNKQFEAYTARGIRVLTEAQLCDLLTNDSYALMEHHRISVKFVCDRGVSHEFVRHRDASFAQESTRYCNYTKDKFDEEITVIEPFFFKNDREKYKQWKCACQVAELTYFALIAGGASPQEARSVLPNSLKTELLITATENEWQHICALRAKGTTGAPHPQMKEVMEPCYRELVKLTNHRII